MHANLDLQDNALLPLICVAYCSDGVCCAPTGGRLLFQDVPAALWTSNEGRSGPAEAARKPLYLVHR